MYITGVVYCKTCLGNHIDKFNVRLEPKKNKNNNNNIITTILVHTYSTKIHIFEY